MKKNRGYWIPVAICCVVVLHLIAGAAAQGRRGTTDTRISSGQIGIFPGNDVEVRLAVVDRNQPVSDALIRIVDREENVLVEKSGSIAFGRPLSLTLSREDINRLGSLFTVRVDAFLEHPLARDTGRTIMTVQRHQSSASSTLTTIICPVPGGDLPPQKPETEFYLICGDCGCTIISDFATGN